MSRPSNPDSWLEYRRRRQFVVEVDRQRVVEDVRGDHQRAERRQVDELARIAQKACDNTRSVGVSTKPGSIPATGAPTFDLADDVIGLGMGIHGEPGIWRDKLKPAEAIRMLNSYERALKGYTYLQLNGGANSAKSVAFRYGYVEARVRMPKGFALWPALWLRDWQPWSYEIDALEGFDALRGAQALDRLVDDLSNWYLRRNRRRFWKSGQGLASRWQVVTSDIKRL